MRMVGPAIVGVAFWIFVTVAAVAGIVGDYKRRRLELETLRIALERGQTLDPALLERLMSRPRQDQRPLEPLPLRVGGIITIAAGVGIALLSPFIRLLALVAFLPVLGAGVLVVCIGVGLLLAARAVQQHAERSARRTPPLPPPPPRLQDGPAA
jgi:hypothetical protein